MAPSAIPRHRFPGHGQLYLHRDRWSCYFRAGDGEITVYSMPVANADAYTTIQGQTLTINRAGCARHRYDRRRRKRSSHGGCLSNGATWQRGLRQWLLQHTPAAGTPAQIASPLHPSPDGQRRLRAGHADPHGVLLSRGQPGLPAVPGKRWRTMRRACWPTTAMPTAGRSARSQSEPATAAGAQQPTAPSAIRLVRLLRHG